MNNFFKCLLPLVFVFISACSAEMAEQETMLIKVVREDSASSFLKAQRILTDIPIQMAEGLNIDLWASEILAPDPIAMSIDDWGSIYLTRTNRQKNSEFDIRGHEDWMTRSISLKTVEERRDLLKEIFATEKSEQNS